MALIRLRLSGGVGRKLDQEAHGGAVVGHVGNI